ncbi:MAG: acyl carrier protein [Saprospiraceae bacterium]|jgi:acyl carrier protein
MVATTKKIPSTDQIIEMISWSLHIPLSRINPNTDFTDDLHLDQLDLELLIADLENRLGIFLSPEEVASIETVRDASRFLQKKAA